MKTSSWVLVVSVLYSPLGGSLPTSALSIPVDAPNFHAFDHRDDLPPEQWRITEVPTVDSELDESTKELYRNDAETIGVILDIENTPTSILAPTVTARTNGKRKRQESTSTTTSAASSASTSGSGNNDGNGSGACSGNGNGGGTNNGNVQCNNVDNGSSASSSSGGLTRDQRIAIGIGVPSGVIALVGVIVAIYMCCCRRATY